LRQRTQRTVRAVLEREMDETIVHMSEADYKKFTKQVTK
jgi:hypothetical protein